MRAFITITKDEFENIKQEVKEKFGHYCRIKQHKQKYALGGFELLPKNREEGFTNEQIDELRLWLVNHHYDVSGFDLERDEVYDDSQGKFAGTKVNHLIFKQYISFIMKWEYIQNA